jgi:hypothetical protein
MLIALIVVLILVAGAGVTVVVWQRANRPTAQASDVTDVAGGELVPAAAERVPGPDDLILVPLPNRRNEGLVVGSAEALAILDESGLTARRSADTPGALPQLVRAAMGAGGTEATRRASGHVDSGRLVMLAPETVEHMKKGKPVYDSAGNVLALVRGDRGRLKHVARFDKAGAQAAMASNAATLAVTAALSQQLDQIAEQLTEISETLAGMVADNDRERLADIVAANQVLCEIAASIERRGITQADATQLAALKPKVLARQIEAEFKLAEVVDADFSKVSRAKRADKLGEILEKERLEYWLAVRVQADLARTRTELITLYWENHQHPETAAALNASTAKAIADRQSRMAALAEALTALTDPRSNTRLDPLRQLSRRELMRYGDTFAQLLERHEVAFQGPDEDRYALLPGAVPALPTGDETGRCTRDTVRS